MIKLLQIEAYNYKLIRGCNIRKVKSWKGHLEGKTTRITKILTRVINCKELSITKEKLCKIMYPIYIKNKPYTDHLYIQDSISWTRKNVDRNKMFCLIFRSILNMYTDQKFPVRLPLQKKIFKLLVYAGLKQVTDQLRHA